MALIAIAQNRRMSDYVESIRRAGGEPIEHAVTMHATARYPYTMMLYRAAR